MTRYKKLAFTYVLLTGTSFLLSSAQAEKYDDKDTIPSSRTFSEPSFTRSIGSDGKNEPHLSLSLTSLLESPENLKPTIISQLVKDKNKKLERIVPSIGIPIRGIADDKDGQGTFYDHFVFQKMTGYSTIMLLPKEAKLEDISTHMRSFARQLPYGLQQGNFDEKAQKNLPSASTELFFDGGLLVIPGRMRDREFDANRFNHEHYLIRQALCRGQPILALCAGSWRLWQSIWLEGIAPNRDKSVNLESLLQDVEDHSANRMMSLSTTTPKVNYNTMMHGLNFQKETLLYKFLGNKDTFPSDDMQVNSVHWKAPCLPVNIDNYGHVNIEIAARSKNTKKLDNKNRHGKVMSPAENIIEGFSSIYGAPMVGVGWHPEASDKQDLPSSFNQNLVRNMAKAGEAYAKKRYMLREFMQISSSVNTKVQEPSTEFLENNHSVKKVTLANAHTSKIKKQHGKNGNLQENRNVASASSQATHLPSYKREHLAILLDFLHGKFVSDAKISSYTNLSSSTIYRLRTDDKRIPSAETVWSSLKKNLNHLCKDNKLDKGEILRKVSS